MGLLKIFKLDCYSFHNCKLLAAGSQVKNCTGNHEIAMVKWGLTIQICYQKKP